MATAICVHETGGPEVLRLEDVEVPAPGPGEVVIRHHACGVNFVDTYFRSGLNKPERLPFIPGNEAAGDVTSVGPGVTEVKVGDRVAYSHALGAYASERIMPATRVVPIPDGISYDMAAAATLKGTTAYYLLHATFRVEAGMTVLVHAAAGGVGSLLCQWASQLGARVIGTVGSREKAELASAAGCDEVILYREEDFAARVKELTVGRLCDVVYDGIGIATFPASLNCLRPRGMLVSFGSASGPIRALDVNLLAQTGSLYVTRPTGAHYLGSRDELLNAASSVFDMIKGDRLKVRITRTYPLADAHQAHRDLEGRATTGSLILRPS